MASSVFSFESFKTYIDRLIAKDQICRGESDAYSWSDLVVYDCMYSPNEMSRALLEYDIAELNVMKQNIVIDPYKTRDNIASAVADLLKMYDSRQTANKETIAANISEKIDRFINESSESNSYYEELMDIVKNLRADVFVHNSYSVRNPGSLMLLD